MTKKFVIKRNGKRELFNSKRIEFAILSAFIEARGKSNLDEEIEEKIQEMVKTLENDCCIDNLIKIEDLQTKIEQLLVEKEAFDVAEAYVSYRLKHDIERKKKEQFSKNYEDLFKQNDFLNRENYNENANKDASVISTRRALQNEATAKMLVCDFILRPEWRKAHEEGWIYIHDLADLFLKTFNCNLFDFGNLLKNKEHEDGFYAFKINNKVTHEPKHVSTAFELMSSVTITASSQQFGGFTISEVDRILAPYADKSYQFYLDEAEKYEIPNKEKYAEEKTLREIQQGVQSYTYELAQTQNSLGQSPFNTISFGLDTSKWGRVITREIIKDRMKPENIDVFPKLVFLSRGEINRDPFSPNYDLYKLSLECSRTKLYPDYLSLDYNGEGEHYRRDVYERSGEAISPMGCRAHLSPFQLNGKDIVNGRFNIGAVTINFVKIALESNGDAEEFAKLTEKYANMIFDILDWRYSQVGELKGSSNPLFWCEGGAFERIKLDQLIRDSRLLDGATASIGYVGLNEAVNAFVGEDYENISRDTRHTFQEKMVTSY